MPHDSDAIAIAEAQRDQAQRDQAQLEREAKYGREHVYAGYCGDDDARDDLITDLRAWLRPKGVTS